MRQFIIRRTCYSIITLLILSLTIFAVVRLTGDPATLMAEPGARAGSAQVLSRKERPFVQVGRLSGLSGFEIVWSELLPHLLPWLGANFVNAFIAAILAESGLSILGLGPQQEMTLGMMIFWALSYSAIFLNLWWWWLTPVVTLMAVFLSLYLIHLGLDEVGNPRLRTQA